MTTEQDLGATGDASVAPIIADLGSISRKKYKRIKKGKGGAAAIIQAAIDEVRESVDLEVEGKVLVPVVLLCKKKSKKKRRNWPF